MDIKLPTDCGNAPRVAIVGDFVTNWAKRDSEAASEWLRDDTAWSIIGGDTHVGADAARGAAPPFNPERLVVNAIITHGWLASCDGYVEDGEKRIDFSHAFRFAGAVKTAKIAEIRSYYVETSTS